jgi:hypothetical protein
MPKISNLWVFVRLRWVGGALERLESLKVETSIGRSLGMCLKAHLRCLKAQLLESSFEMLESSFEVL